jgi:hypothetical protein
MLLFRLVSLFHPFGVLLSLEDLIMPQGVLALVPCLCCESSCHVDSELLCATREVLRSDSVYFFACRVAPSASKCGRGKWRARGRVLFFEHVAWRRAVFRNIECHYHSEPGRSRAVHTMRAPAAMYACWQHRSDVLVQRQQAIHVLPLAHGLTAGPAAVAVSRCAQRYIARRRWHFLHNIDKGFFSNTFDKRRN